MRRWLTIGVGGDALSAKMHITCRFHLSKGGKAWIGPNGLLQSPDRMLPLQPRVFTVGQRRAVNQRRVRLLVFHLLHAGRLEQATKELLHREYLGAKLAVGESFALHRELSQARVAWRTQFALDHHHAGALAAIQRLLTLFAAVRGR